MGSGERIPFGDAFNEVSRGVKKFKQNQYVEHGAHPIIDQGQELIAGYSDDETGLFTDVPAIVFGDHTRCVKYIEEPFFAGADGVKILKPKLSDNTRFWWHALKATPIENLGYSRHFKLLKAATFKSYDEAGQTEIAARLDGILDQISRAEQQLDRLDDLVKSRFVEMFGAGGYSSVPLSEVAHSMRNGLSPSKSGTHHAKVLTLSAITQGCFDATAWKLGFFVDEPPADKRLSNGDFYICRGNGNKQLVGVGEYSSGSNTDLVFPDTMIAVKLDLQRVSLPFLRCAWSQPAVREQIETSAKTTNGTFKINQASLGKVKIPLPSMSEQQEFAAFVSQVDKARAIARQQVAKLQLLYDSLAQEYFGE